MSDTNDQKTTLYFKDSRSDKIYQAQLTGEDDGYIVTFQYGRRGSTLKNGKKTTNPVDYDKAKKIFDKLVAGKMKKGYSPGEDGIAYQNTDLESRATGIAPQLLNPITKEQVRTFVASDLMICQEKHDGERGLTKKDDQGVIGINRKGLSRALPKTIEDAFSQCEAVNQCVVDGELLGDKIVVFDILQNDDGDLTTRPYHERLVKLDSLCQLIDHPAVEMVETAYTQDDKQALLDTVKTRNGEGVVFKARSALYIEGRPASMGDQLKYKFYETASVIVTGVNDGKRSVQIAVLDGDKQVNVGNCTIPANQDVPETDDIIEVRYLYAFEGGSLFQPVYLGKRTDIDRADCASHQLKYKAA